MNPARVFSEEEKGFPCKILLSELSPTESPPPKELVGLGTILEMTDKIFMRIQDGAQISRPQPSKALPAYKIKAQLLNRFRDANKGKPASYGETLSFMENLDQSPDHFALKPGMVLMINGDPGLDSYLFGAPVTDFAIYRKEGDTLVKTDLFGTAVLDLVIKSTKLLRPNEVPTLSQQRKKT
ncbi:MAG: hypothetical protein JWQ35_2317 [Bacteriovoracaceae bacterium]|nr:hypothetical protein [Bacteriovoracaceae bacterium]